MLRAEHKCRAKEVAAWHWLAGWLPPLLLL
jgi:hypothetical protein